MKQNDSWLASELQRSRLPVLPPGLKERTLAAAAAVEMWRPRPWERLWTNRPARLAWAATVAGLLLLNGAAAREGAAPASAPPQLAEAGELGDVIRRYPVSRASGGVAALLALLCNELEGNEPARQGKKESQS